MHLFSQQILVGPPLLCVGNTDVCKGDSVLPLTALAFGWGDPQVRYTGTAVMGKERAGKHVFGSHCLGDGADAQDW